MNDSSSALDAFLGAQRSEGRYFDTSTFSIDSLKALEKLGQHQLPESGLWLVKLIQAAVRSGADKVEVTFERLKVGVAFTPGQEWQADDILQVVLSGTLTTDPALAHLVTALRASSASTTEAVSWSCGDAHVFLGHGTCKITEQPATRVFHLEAFRPARSRSFAKTLSSSVSQLAKQTVEEDDALRARCWTCPIPIVVDGEPFTTGYAPTRAGWVEKGVGQVMRRQSNSKSYTVEACVGIRPLEREGVERPALPYLVEISPAAQRPYFLSKPVYKEGTFLSWTPSGVPCWGAVAFLSGPTVESRIDFVLDGVVVESRPLARWPLKAATALGITFSSHARAGLRFLFAVDQTEVDLSGFSVRDIGVDKLLDHAIPESLELLHAVQKRLGNFYFVPVKQRYIKVLGAGLAAQAVVMAAATKAAALAPFCGIMAVSLAINTAQWRSQIKTRLVDLIRMMSSATSAPP